MISLRARTLLRATFYVLVTQWKSKASRLVIMKPSSICPSLQITGAGGKQALAMRGN